MTELIEKLRQWVAESDNMVFFGGAGVSTESGIPDFRMVQGTTHTNLIFDAVLPFSSGKTPEQAAEEIRQLVRQLNDTNVAVGTVEHSYTD